MGAPFAGRGGAVSGPHRCRFIFPEGGLGAFQVVGIPTGRGRPEKGLGNLCRLLYAYCFWRQPHSVPPSVLLPG